MVHSRTFKALTVRILAVCLFAAAATTASDAGARAKAGILYEIVPSNPRGVVVLSHDWFGDSSYYRSIGKDLAGEGYGVIASDLYQGKPGGTNHAEAWALLKELTEAHADSVLDATIDAAAKRADNVWLMGFSAGAPHAMRAAIRRSDIVDGVIVFYGDAIRDATELSRLNGPALVIYGSKDATYGETTAAGEAATFIAAADEAGIKVEVHIYSGAAHAFAQPLFNAGDTYDAELAEAALELTLGFIGRASAPKRCSLELSEPS